MTHLLQTAQAWVAAGRKVALGMVVETWGSAPRPVGSLLVMDHEGAMEGSVSGGCVEGAVMVEALEAIEDGKPRLLTYGVSDDDAFAVGLACGGTIRVLVEPVGAAMPAKTLADLADRIAAKQPVAYVTDLEGGQNRIAGPDEFPERFRLDRSGVEEDGRSFVAIYNPPLRMAVVGGVHIAQHLLPMARACGFDPVLVDPRPAFASPERFPDTALSDLWPDEALAEMGMDTRTAVVTLTHDPKLDDPALRAALGSEVFYIGALGSKRTHAKRIERLTEAGFSEDQIARIHAPVGIDLGGRSPAEIAVSVMAEVIETLRKG